MAPERPRPRNDHEQGRPRLFLVRCVLWSSRPASVPNRATAVLPGPYYCIGRPLAYHQMRYALCRLVLAFDMEFEEGFDPATFGAGVMNMRTMFLKEELRVSLKRRPGVDFDKLVY